MPSFNIADYGAVGDGKTDNAASIQRAIGECHASGGGRVAVPAGVAVDSPERLARFDNAAIPLVGCPEVSLIGENVALQSSTARTA